MSLSGFWSYVRLDDDAEGGRIAQLARDIVMQFEMLTNDEVDLFLDRDSLEWGAHWQARIDDALADVAFFVPVLTPRYFASPACRAELNAFARSANELGVGQLLLPILYLDVPGVEDDDPDDDLIALARSFNWVDFRKIGLLDRDASQYRQAVRALAQRLAEANRDAERSPVAHEAATRVAEQESGEGFLDVMARFEESLPEIAEVTEKVGAQVVTIGEVVQAAASDINSGAMSTFAGRLQVTRALASNLAAPSHDIGELGDRFAARLHDLDAGVRLIIDRAPHEPEARDQFCAFFEQLRELSRQADAGLGSLASMADQAQALETASRDLRPVIREMRRGITLITEGRSVMSNWVTLIDESEFECAERA